MPIFPGLVGCPSAETSGWKQHQRKSWAGFPSYVLIMMLVQFPTAAHMFLFPTLLNSNIGDVAGKESIALPKIILE